MVPRRSLRTGLLRRVWGRVRADGRVDDGNESAPSSNRIRRQDQVIFDPIIFNQVISDQVIRGQAILGHTRRSRAYFNPQDYFGAEEECSE
jgi:hypothetical protein